MLAGVLLLALGAGSAWGALTVLRPAEDPLEVTNFTFVEVVEGEVGASVTLNTVAKWTPEPVGVNRAEGVLTSVEVSAGDEVSQGATLYTVGLRPVVIAQGEVPAFRTIALGIEGPDVEQLQVMLGALGHYGGTADGKAGAGTVAAIKAWQDTLGLEMTGEVGVGDVIFVPSLPMRVALDTEIVDRGASLGGGEEVVQGLPSEPEFWIPVTDTQAGMLTTGTRVEITSPDGGAWEAHAGDQRRDENDAVTVALTGMEGGSICGDGCGQVPVIGQATLSSQIITVESVKGLIVPSAALITQADGQIAVIDDEEMMAPVTVEASAKGMSVITGVETGTRVRVPATATE
ncbi:MULTISPECIES: peptidoglycan-binding domain-containing protein [Actinomycetes]|uniref:Peptidoglycan-binding domain-containing protein n=1 Tax=Microbacterium profundi TaxID=450380 RepID=A0ABV3LNR5_9MICO|nr:peptidoglycan-binding domain-containing protein [Microbacterium profundi]